MKGFRACFWKDMRLMFQGAGWAALALPLLVALALRAGTGDMLKNAYLQPFPIAVRDLDETAMSRSLANQMRGVELFSNIVKVGPGQEDEELFSQGCAAVITIPKDFFYQMYTMDNQIVEMSLNGEMPVEAALFSSVGASVMEIIAANQAVERAVFRFCYGELSPQRQQELWEQTSQYLIEDALGRQQVFDEAAAAGDAVESLELRFLAGSLSLLCLFFSLCAAKTLPEERDSRALSRFLAAGGGICAFFLSKFVSGFLVSLPAAVLLLPLRPWGDWPQLFLLLFLLYACAFCFFALAASFANNGEGLQRFGNGVLLLSMALGGTLYAGELLPGFARGLGRLALPRFALDGLESIQRGAGAWGLLERLWPLCAAALLFGGLFPACFAHRDGGGSVFSKRGKARRKEFRSGVPEAVPAFAGFRVLRLAFQKLKAMSGGAVSFFAMLAVLLFCGCLAASALGREGPEKLRIAAVREDESKAAAQLAERVGAQEGVALLPANLDEGERLLARGEVEGLWVIPAGYGQALEEGGGLGLSYQSAAASVSARAAREIIAGQAAAQQARARGLLDAEKRLGRDISAAEREKLLKDMDREEKAYPPLYRASVSGKARQAADPFAPSQMGMAAFAVMLSLFTWTAWTGRPDARRVEGRMAALPYGTALSYGSDVLAGFLAGTAAGLCALLPGGIPSFGRLLCLMGYALCVTGLSLALARASAGSGRIDALAPFTALLTSLLGGCFGDVGQVSALLRQVSLLTPQGLALRADSGSLPALAMLVVFALIFLALGAPFPRAARSGKS